MTNLASAEAPWSRFHGADGHGYVADGDLPVTWTDEDYAWRRPLGSRDVGSPIISDGKVYYLVSKPESNELALESLDLETGKLRWQRSYQHQVHRVHRRNTLASSTPAADEQNVFIAFADPQHTYLKCLDHDGNEIWSRDFGSWQAQHGFGTSPRILGSLVLLMNSQQADRLEPGAVPGQSRMIAVDRQTGQTKWETKLSTTRTCYGIPAVHRRKDGSVQLIGANTGDGIFGMDAESGQMLWNLKVFGKRCCSTPLVIGDLAIGTCGSGGGGNELAAVRIPGSPAEQPTEIYRIRRAAPYVPTPAVKDNRIFTIDDKGIASCLDAATGAVIWSERIGGNFGASPVVVGDKLLVISLSGQATVLRAADRFEKLGEIDLGGPVGATPAFSDGKLLIRVDEEISCLGPKAI
jgi:outer membrane protein assembly factor BamB